MKVFKNPSRGPSIPSPANGKNALTEPRDADIGKEVEDVKLEEGSTIPAHQYVDLDLEKRLVRKLDFHVIPLVMALCKKNMS